MKEPKETTRQVTVIGRKNKAALVEYLDGDTLKRVTIPSDKVDKEGVVELKELTLGIPYGLPWSEVIVLVATPQHIETELHMRGIWTAEDALAQPNTVIAAVQAAYGLDVAAILQAANAIRGGKTDNGK